ncbi:MAG: hypothetical protein FJ253_08505, partial [Phycisphaerae bacterium]|nr:hypothetical protein [Phycisphaerae bacterium]
MTAPSVQITSAGAIDSPRGSLLGRSISAWRESTRRELGIPVIAGLPVVGAGHQPGFWHPGILAKFVHARAAAGADGTLVHVVVDHDAVDPSLVRVPIRRNGRLAATTHRFGTAHRGEAAMSLPSFSPRRFDGETALASVDAGLARAADALDAARAAPNAARQTADAVASLVRRWCGRAALVAASDFLSTSFGAALVDEMRRDPQRCADAFNRALRLEPRAAAPLRAGRDAELPLWTLADDGRRTRVSRSMLGEGRTPRLLPRAFLVGAFMRLA